MICRTAAVGAAAILTAACSDEQGRRYTADLPPADSVAVGAPVQYRGIEVGRVVQVEHSVNRTRLTLSVTRVDARARQADSVRIVPLGIFGDRAAEIVMGPLSVADAPTAFHLASAGPLQPSVGQAGVMKALGDQAMEELARQGLRERSRRP